MGDVPTNNRHRLVLQHFISKGVLDIKEVETVLAHSKERFQEVGEDIDLRQFLQAINGSIAPFNLEIKRGFQEDDIDGPPYYCLVNTVETPISLLSSTYSSNELDFFKKLVEKIVDSVDGKVGTLMAMSITDTLQRKMGKEEAEDLLNRFETDQWIKKDNKGKICLSVRSILELEQYLKKMYPDVIKMCYLCAKICLLGETCINCATKFHFKCAHTLFKKQGLDRKCPDCRVPWNDETIVSSGL